MIEETPVEPQAEKRVNQVGKKFKTRRELRMTAQIGDYDMDYIILDLGSNVNILMRQTWESMGKPHLDWSPVQLQLSNQAKVLPIGRLSQVPVDMEGLRTFAYFEVINIFYDMIPYPALLGIDWAIDNQTIIKFKKKILSFEDNEMRVVFPIDPWKEKDTLILSTMRDKETTLTRYTMSLPCKKITSIQQQMET